jgi:hypothetical protein
MTDEKGGFRRSSSIFVNDLDGRWYRIYEKHGKNHSVGLGAVSCGTYLGEVRWRTVTHFREELSREYVFAEVLCQRFGVLCSPSNCSKSENDDSSSSTGGKENQV